MKLYIVIVHIVRAGKSVEGVWKGSLLLRTFPPRVLRAVEMS